MRRIIFIFIFVVISVFAFSNSVFVPLYSTSLGSDVSVTKGYANAGSYLLFSPYLVPYVRNYEFNLLVGVLPYDRFAGVGNLSFSLERISGLSYLGGLGFSFAYLGMNNIELFDDNAQSLGVYSYYSYGLALTIGSDLREFVKFPLDWGINFKYSLDSLKETSSSGFGVDIGIMTKPLSTVQDLGFKLALLDLYSLKQWNTGISEINPISLNVGAFYSFFDDTLLTSFDFTVFGRYNEIFTFRNTKFSLSGVYLVLPNLLLRANFSYGGEISVNVGVSYSLNFAKVEYNSVLDGLGINNIGKIEFGFGDPKFFGKPISPEVVKAKEAEKAKQMENEEFAKAMLYFANNDYKNAKSQLEKVLKINPDNTTAKAMLQKIEEILSLEE
ncbi:MAG: tetratricopeptide repeat protein [Brevinematia bacterium]